MAFLDFSARGIRKLRKESGNCGSASRETFHQGQKNNLLLHVHPKKENWSFSRVQESSAIRATGTGTRVLHASLLPMKVSAILLEYLHCSVAPKASLYYLGSGCMNSLVALHRFLVAPRSLGFASLISRYP